MKSLAIEILPALKDNYIYLLCDVVHGLTAVVDPGDPQTVLKAIEDREQSLDFIWNTHHHWDHTDGNLELKERTGATIVGPEKDKERIPGIDIGVKEGDVFEFGNHKIEFLETPGHTLGAICWYFKDKNLIFVGDTYFALGCGRVFEGDAKMMWSSLEKLKALPEQTLFYCGHEYSVKNAEFTLSIDPANPEAKLRLDQFEEQVKRRQPTLPVRLSDEIRTNLFLQCEDIALRRVLDLKRSCKDWEVFAELRRRRDTF